jgi:hypothetical protein
MDPFETPVTAESRSAALPQLRDRLFITDSGLETTLIHRHYLDLPAFAAFVLLETNAGRQRLRAYFEGHAAIARAHGAGFIAESPTWRANPDWARDAGLRRRPPGGDQPRRDHPARRAARPRRGDLGHLRHQRVHRTAPRRL